MSHVLDFVRNFFVYPLFIFKLSLSGASVNIFIWLNQENTEVDDFILLTIYNL